MDLSKHAFFEGKIVPLAEAKINIAVHGFMYGTTVFSGMRAYWSEEKKRLFVFRPYEHFHRLCWTRQRSCPCPFPTMSRR